MEAATAPIDWKSNTEARPQTAIRLNRFDKCISNPSPNDEVMLFTEKTLILTIKKPASENHLPVVNSKYEIRPKFPYKYTVIPILSLRNINDYMYFIIT